MPLGLRVRFPPGPLMNLRKSVVAGAIAALGAGALWMTREDPVVVPDPRCVPPNGLVCELASPCLVRETTTAPFCYSCHDGSVAVGIPGSHSLDPTRDHPVDVSYYTARTELVPFPSEKLVLVNGSLVSCTTCHNYWAVPQQSKWVAVPISELCTSCHVK